MHVNNFGGFLSLFVSVFQRQGHKCALKHLLSPLEEKNETHHQRGGESIFPAPECL